MSSRIRAWALLFLATMVVGVAFASGQPRARVATLDDLLAELRALRADMNTTAEASMQVQVLVARATLQERRLEALSKQHREAQDELEKAEAMRSTERGRLEQFEEGLQGGRLPPGVPIHEVDNIIATLRDNTLPQLLERERRLSRRVGDLAGALAREESRWTELNARLDEIERANSRPPR